MQTRTYIHVWFSDFLVLTKRNILPFLLIHKTQVQSIFQYGSWGHVDPRVHCLIATGNTPSLKYTSESTLMSCVDMCEIEQKTRDWSIQRCSVPCWHGNMKNGPQGEVVGDCCCEQVDCSIWVKKEISVNLEHLASLGDRPVNEDESVIWLNAGGIRECILKSACLFVSGVDRVGSNCPGAFSKHRD